MDLKRLFPRASSSFLKANAAALNGIAPQMQAADAVQTNVAPLPTKRRGTMNNTEYEFSVMLEIQKNAGEILRWEYEPLRLRWGDTMFYKPDFLVLHRAYIKLIEVKGAHIWDRDLVRYKGCKAQWKECFVFEMHQRTRNGWQQID